MAWYPSSACPKRALGFFSRRAPLEREQFDRFGLAAQQTRPDAPGEDIDWHGDPHEKRTRNQHAMTGCPTGLFDPRGSIHGVADEGNLPLEGADPCRNQRTAMDVARNPGISP